jgi:cyclohexa-1,5-dienecarbonyl-CoA hydratase
MKATAQVRLERSGRITRVVLDRPPLNILDIATLEELDAALDEASRDESTAVVVLTGAGRAFCAGIDVADHMGDSVGPMLDTFHSVIERLLSIEAPVVAAVNGAALGGGCELLMACDLVVAREGAKLGQPEIRLGVFPPVAAALLPARIGVQRALDLILTGRTFSAEEGQALGLVSRVIPGDDFAAGVDAFVSDLASLSPPVLRLAKCATLVRATGAAERLDRAERLYANDLMRLADAHEGLAAFLEKRQPVWKGA